MTWVPAQAFTTHQIVSPSDQLLVATCRQVGCERYFNGWWMVIDERTPQGEVQAAAIRSGKHGRTFTERGRTTDGRTAFWFDPYQRCFQDHRTRPELFVVHRGTPSQHLAEIRRHARPELWVEDYRETLDRRLTDIERRR